MVIEALRTCTNDWSVVQFEAKQTNNSRLNFKPY